MATTAGRDAALADAYAALVRDGEVPTVRRMKEKASVSTDAAAAWLRVNRPDVDVPEAPAAFVTAVWPVAFAAAREGAMESLAAELDEARAHEADAQESADLARTMQARAEAAADEARHDLADAQAARDAAVAQVAALTDEVADLRAQAQQADQAHQAERDRLAREMREVEARAVRAESTADAIREALDGLRADLRQAMNRTTQQAKK